MFDAASPSSPPVSGSAHQRARGALRIEMKPRGATTVLGDRYQEGCLKARFPRPTGWAEAVLLNSSGGIAGGDRLRTELRVREGGQASFAGQAAERFYRALPGDAPAHVRTELTIEPGASAEWLPQESILFDHTALDRVLDVRLAEDGWFLGVESLVFGRTAMGETVRDARLRDVIRVRRGGRLLLHDAIRLDGSVAGAMARRAIAAGGAAVATLVHVAPDAAAKLDALRAVWADNRDAGASAWDGMLVGRVVARDGACLRRMVVAGLQILRGGRLLPRVWMC
jgi:urease accessory protein